MSTNKSTIDQVQAKLQIPQIMDDWNNAHNSSDPSITRHEFFNSYFSSLRNSTPSNVGEWTKPPRTQHEKQPLNYTKSQICLELLSSFWFQEKSDNSLQNFLLDLLVVMRLLILVVLALILLSVLCFEHC